MTTLDTPPEPGTLRIQRARGLAALNLAELWAFRDLFSALAHRDVKLRYRQTLLGVVWVLVQPLLMAGAVTLLFGMMGKDHSAGGLPIFLVMFASQVAWNTFASTLNKTSGCLVGNAQLVSKVFFPRLILPASTTVSTFIDTGVALLLFIPLALFWGVVPSLSILTLPLWMLLAVLFGTGLGLYAAALMVSYRDIQFILPLATQIFMFGSPVFYTLAEVKKDHLRFLCSLNPATGMMEGFRWSLLGGPAPEPWVLTYSAATIFVIFLAGTVSFKHMERKFADVI